MSFCNTAPERRFKRILTDAALAFRAVTIPPGGVRAGMLRKGVREVVVLDLKGNTLGRFVTENTNAHVAGGKAEEDRADAIADCRCNLQPGCGRESAC